MRFQQKVLAAALGGVLFLGACDQKNVKSFVVDGTLENAQAATTIFLEEATIDNMQPVVVDSAQVGADGRFKLNSTGKEESIYLLRLDGQPNPFASLINDSKKITLRANVADPAELYTVEGSKASKSLRDYLEQSNKKLTEIFELSMQLDSLMQTRADSTAVAAVAANRQKITGAYKGYVTDQIKNSPSAPLSIFVLGSYQSYAASPALGLEPLESGEVTELINQTAEKFPDHKALASLKSSLEGSAAMGLMNQPAPDFTLPDVNGKEVSLSSFKGKYVLVDFWASWCGPCRQENPNVVKAYEQFKDKNFTILGVSLDKEKEPWLKAIQADKLAWTHVSDLKFWESSVVPMYNIEGIPYNVLLDPNGVVIAEGLRGDQLISKLSEVLN